MPDEARQPSTFVEMVPIHAKQRFVLRDERKGLIYDAFLLMLQKGFLFFRNPL
ncbi:hypothetical protein J2S08_003635 [Bacillus chungangensis]|uniref:Uncharacterized protein n=1 Tax=Bacillus chungangensis TaxID=587633 RepID=A0ABT9WXA6_9BACI|nr:hypothetical protein [Bacillus chungangensis]